MATTVTSNERQVDDQRIAAGGSVGAPVREGRTARPTQVFMTTDSKHVRVASASSFSTAAWSQEFVFPKAVDVGPFVIVRRHHDVVELRGIRRSQHSQVVVAENPWRGSAPGFSGGEESMTASWNRTRMSSLQ